MKNELGYPVCIGNKRRITAIDDSHVFVTIEDEIVRPQASAPHKKLIYLQKMSFSDGHTEYRFTYYMIGVKAGKSKGRWVFGQYSLMAPPEDVAYLIEEARKKRWTGF